MPKLAKLAIYSLLIILSCGQFAAISRGEGVNIYIFDLAVGMFALLGTLHFLLTGSLKIPRYLVLFFLFACVAGLSLVPVSSKLVVSELVIAGSYLLRFLLYLLSGVVIFNMLEHKFITVVWLCNALLFSGVLFVVLGILQLFVLPDFSTLDPVLGWDPHKNRLASTFFDPNFVGGYFVLCVALCSYMLGRHKSLRYWLVLLLLLGGVLLTFSRSTWLATALVIFVFGVFKNRWILWVALLVVFLAYFAVPRVQTRISGTTDPADSAQYRLISWQNAMQIAQDNLFLGVGFNAYRFAQQEYGFFDSGTSGGNAGAGADSSMLFVLATTGVIGAVVFGAAYLFPFFEVLVTKNEFAVVIISASLGLLAQSQFINALFYPQILFLWLMCLVCASYLYFRT